MKKTFGKHCYVFLITIVILALPFSGCKNSSVNSKVLKNGYYVAEMIDYDSHGWKEFVSIYINNGHIITVEYDAKNSSGFIKSWDPVYMREMNADVYTYPNKFTREYAFTLLNFQEINRIDVVSGATHSYETFRLLAQAVIEQAKTGNKHIALVEYPEPKLPAKTEALMQ